MPDGRGAEVAGGAGGTVAGGAVSIGATSAGDVWSGPSDVSAGAAVGDSLVGGRAAASDDAVSAAEMPQLERSPTSAIAAHATALRRWVCSGRSTNSVVPPLDLDPTDPN